MCDADAGVDAAIDGEGSEDLRGGRYAGSQDGRREAVESEGCVAAEVAKEAACDPPEPGAKCAAGKEEREAQQQEDVCHLVAQFPWADFAGDLDDAVLGLAEVVQDALDFEVDGEGKPGEAIDEDAVVNISAGGVVAGEGGGPLPDFAAAAGVLVVAIAEGLVGDEVEALEEKKGEQTRRYALRKIEAEAANPGEAMGHSDEVGRNLF